jgi:hypothetical protein
MGKTPKRYDTFAADTLNDVSLARRVSRSLERAPPCGRAPPPGIEGRLRVIPHGWISPLGRNPDVRRPGADILRIGHWGHLSTLKGIDLLLNALTMLGDAVKSKIHLDLFGDAVYPAERPMVEDLVARLPVTWHQGPYKPESLMNVPLDVAVIPSRCSESHSFVLDEAFLLGLPAIVPDVGALAERLNGAGATFTAGDAASLAGVLSELAGRQDGSRRLAPPHSEGPEPSPTTPWRSTRSTGRRSAWRLPLRDDAARAPRTTAVVPSRRAERRNAMIDHLRGDLSNARSDIVRATAAMAEMEHYHKEKDKVIEWLKSQAEELGALKIERNTTKAQYEQAIATLKDTTQQLRAELLEARRGYSETVLQLEALIGDAKTVNSETLQRLAAKDMLLDEVARAFAEQTRRKRRTRPPPSVGARHEHFDRTRARRPAQFHVVRSRRFRSASKRGIRNTTRGRGCPHRNRRRTRSSGSRDDAAFGATRIRVERPDRPTGVGTNSTHAASRRSHPHGGHRSRTPEEAPRGFGRTRSGPPTAGRRLRSFEA